MNYPQNEINRVGFPEGQLLGNGASVEECAEISAAYHQGKPMPVTDNPAIDRITARLEQTSGYGQYSEVSNAK
ncbi:hypothetical protein IQ244_20205 [Nostoc sp. LEGE 06077]|uniref:hypothetical protein n=1 Tax=Nostoc sp. LEGE 06077 TaxID=915325 RepID=UPI00187FE476|nr:hypothetical protein [Nostoc sp. LEGE 06077]MBE9208822.1 hypothetical protein [Nostoc sp. LEGE 06077]